MNLIDKAVKLAEQNPNAFIGYFVDNHQQAVDKSRSIGKGKTYSHSMKTVLDNGSTIQFITMKPELSNHIAGYQFTHAVVDVDTYNYEDWLYIRSRVRSPVPHKGMGIYDKYGAYLYYDEED